MFDIIFYKMTCEKNRIDKTQFLTEPKTYSGTLRESSSIINPVITVEEPTSALVGYNYCYIAAWNRYYFITDIVSVTNSLWEISMRVDVLNTFKTGIYNQECIMKRSTLGDGRLYDSEAPLNVPTIFYDHVDYPLSGDYIYKDAYHPTINTYNYVISVISNSDGIITPERTTSPMCKKYAITSNTLLSLANTLLGEGSWGDINIEPSECVQSIILYKLDFENFYNIVKVGDIDAYLNVVLEEEIKMNIGGTSISLKGRPVTYVDIARVNYKRRAFQIINKNGEWQSPFNMPNPYYIKNYGKIFYEVLNYGIVEIDTELFFTTLDTMGAGRPDRPIFLVELFNLDLNTGMMNTTIVLSDNTSFNPNNDESVHIIHELSFKFGIEVPITRTNIAEIIRNKQVVDNNTSKWSATSALSILSSVAMFGVNPFVGAAALAGSLGTMIGGAFELDNQRIQASVKKFASSFGSSSEAKTSNLFTNVNGLWVVSPGSNGYERWKRIKGVPYPTYTTLSLIKNSGYGEVGEIHLENIPSALDEELNEIERLLKSGVHF